MPGAATKLNGKISATLLSQVLRLIGNRGPLTERQDVRAGDQWTVLAMWLSACVGIGSWETPYSPICRKLFLMFCLLTIYIDAGSI